MEACANSRGSNIFSGLMLVGIGVLFLLGNFNVIALREALAYWPVLLILVGIKDLLEFRGQGALLGGVFWLGAGALLLLTTTGRIEIGIWRLITPLGLIWFGVSIFRAREGRCGFRVSDGRSS